MMWKAIFGIAMIGGLMGLFSSYSWAQGDSIEEEILYLKQRIAELEARLEERQLDKMQQQEEPWKPLNYLEKLGVEIHASSVGFFQWAHVNEFNGEGIKDPSGAGGAADFEMSWNPGAQIPSLKNGTLYLRVHYGEGLGADKDLGDLLLANLNTIADDSDDEDLRLLEVYYTQKLLDGRLSLSFGKTEPLAFMDDNAFANDEITQFVGKPFVNNPVLDSEDEYGPIVSLTVSPNERLAMTFIGASSGYPNATEEQQKSVYDAVFDNPFVGFQVAFSPSIASLPGTYRLYYWNALYNHERLDGNGTDEGWGVGMSMDQKLSERLGIFARMGWSNEDVYPVEWFWSGGVSVSGLLPSRRNDEAGLGLAGLKPSEDSEFDETEWHIETYYRFVLSEYMAVSPDIQAVLNPGGNDDNDPVVAFMLKGEVSF